MDVLVADPCSLSRVLPRAPPMITLVRIGAHAHQPEHKQEPAPRALAAKVACPHQRHRRPAPMPRQRALLGLTRNGMHAPQVVNKHGRLSHRRRKGVREAAPWPPKAVFLCLHVQPILGTVENGQCVLPTDHRPDHAT